MSVPGTGGAGKYLLRVNNYVSLNKRHVHVFSSLKVIHYYYENNYEVYDIC